MLRTRRSRSDLVLDAEEDSSARTLLLQNLKISDV